MKEKIRKVIFKAANTLELAISVIIIVVIATLTFKLFFEINAVIRISSIDDILSVILITSFNLVIGIELVKMLVKHSAASVIEVLVYSVARQMVVEHFGAVEILIAVFALLLLFMIRKYLLTDSDTLEKTTYKGNQKVGVVNMLEKIKIPASPNERLSDVILKELNKKNETIEMGAVVSYSGFGLKIVELNDEQIVKIEVIKQIA